MLLTDGSFDEARGSHQLLGGICQAAPEHHALCRWGMEALKTPLMRQFMKTDAVSVLKFGVDLGRKTWNAFLKEQQWVVDQVDKVICHQVGTANQQAILEATGIPEEKDFPSFAFLGNMGTVSLPLTAALADERNFLKSGDRVGFLGIGSGLNCLMLGLRW